MGGACCKSAPPGNDPFTSFSSACYTGNYEKINQELKKAKEKGPLVNAKAADDSTPMHRVAQGGKTEIIDLLLSNGANPRAQNKNKETPLHVACFHRNKDAVVALMNTDARNDVNIHETVHGYTPLHQAINRGSADIVEILLRNEASPLEKDNNGHDAFEMAKFYKDLEDQQLSAAQANHTKVYELVMKKQ